RGSVVQRAAGFVHDSRKRTTSAARCTTETTLVAALPPVSYALIKVRSVVVPGGEAAETAGSAAQRAALLVRLRASRTDPAARCAAEPAIFAAQFRHRRPG